MEHVDVPVEEAKAILAETAVRIGYQVDWAKMLAQSAWWLENRGVPGVTELVVYLMLVRKHAPAALAPKKDPDYGMSCVCPVQAAAIVWNHVDKPALLTSTGFRGPATPLLMAPTLVYLAKDRGYCVRLRYLDQCVVFWDEGIDIQSQSLANFGWVDDDIKDPTLVEFVKRDAFEPEGIHHAYRRLDKLKLPKVRMTGEGYLDLSDKPAGRR